MKTMQPHSSQSEYSLFVGDLPLDCNDDKLQRLFQQKFKSVRRVQIIRHEDGSSRGFGFIRFEDRSELRTALNQEMKIGDTSLRLDLAHNREFPRSHKNRSRFSSFNSTGNNQNNSNHNVNHHNHHNHHNHNTTTTNSASTTSSSLVQPSANAPLQQASTAQQPANVSQQTVNASQQPANASQQPPSASQQPTPQPPSSNRVSQTQTTHPASQTLPATQPTNSSALPQSLNAQHNLTSRVQQTQLNVNSSASSVGTTTISHSTPVSTLTNSHNLNVNPQAIGPDFRGHYQTTTNPMGLDASHLLNSPDQAAMMPPTSVYGPIYPYGPPPFGYMPAQPNPVIPMSGVPPAPPQQSLSTGSVNQQHGAVHSMPPTGSSSGLRYNNTGAHHNHHHQQQQQHHHPVQSHGADSAAALGGLAGGVQGPHQGGPHLYYYYPGLYFDQAGGAPGPHGLYHPQAFHPGFFAMPNPGYMPNAHTYNQHPPIASQSDANLMPAQPQQPQPPQQQTTQTQVMRTRDIDTKLE